MDSEAVPKSPKRAKVSDEESEESTIENLNSRNTESSGTSADSTTPDSEPEQKPEKSEEEVVVISSDDDSDKDAAKTKPEDTIKEEDEDTLTGKPMTTGVRSMETDINDDKNDNTTRVDGDSKSKLQLSDKNEDLKTESQTLDEKLSEKSPASDSSGECISQEDLLAHLGLGSVRALANPKPNKEEKISNGVLSERKPLIPHKPKESIVDLLRAPKLKSHEEKPKVNGEAPITVVNGVSDDDDSTPGTPSEADDDDELLAKEQLIEELRQELRNEEAKLLLLKKIQAAQNDPKSTTKFVKEKENEKLLTSGVQYSSGGKSGSNQLSMKKSQSLPPPPPLKTHISTTGTYQPPVAIQPKLLPKMGNVQSLHGSSLSSSKSVNHMQPSSKSPSRSGSSAIKDLQNVISSMSTSLIHPTPMYPRASSQASVYTTHAQAAPVRPTPVRANNVPGATASSGYLSFPAHISTKASSSSPAVSTAGKQAAAKMALRKQLEKTLLQIPPPKPPPAEWSFIPSLNSNEFMTLVGFEKVVDAISLKEIPKAKSSPPLTEKPQQENPKVCGQCDTDFTPCWKTKNKDGAEVLMCEKCSTVNVKKELKTEHTARLKAAFLKALKQEQEIEQKMGETTPIAPKPQSSKSSSHSSSSSSSSRHHHISHHQGVLHHRHQHVQPGIYHHHQQHPDSLLYQLQQQHIQQQQQEMEVARRHGDVRWHPYTLTQHHHSSHKPQHHHSIVSDSDRQYLLDMIPSLPAQYSSSRI
ncbi:transcriptional repressor p66 alpha-like [Actinia tenebrosa]|uniref:Transcriptional repressor p66 alpha-like n=1 Tax=Actinia tenebrosa TaxID=6105 RepID=A0A6P8IPS8_ACTTE|nr:transcriptional repressor p66 alpha-like [Actinia tenebrosa]